MVSGGCSTVPLETGVSTAVEAMSSVVNCDKLLTSTVAADDKTSPEVKLAEADITLVTA